MRLTTGCLAVLGLGFWLTMDVCGGLRFFNIDLETISSRKAA